MSHRPSRARLPLLLRPLILLPLLLAMADRRAALPRLLASRCALGPS